MRSTPDRSTEVTCASLGEPTGLDAPRSRSELAPESGAARTVAIKIPRAAIVKLLPRQLSHYRHDCTIGRTRRLGRSQSHWVKLVGRHPNAACVDHTFGGRWETAVWTQHESHPRTGTGSSCRIVLMVAAQWL